MPKHTEADLLEAMAKSTSLDEQYRLAADLAKLRNQQAASLQTDKDLELSSEALKAHLTPLPTLTRTSSAADHLGDAQGNLSALERQARQVLGDVHIMDGTNEVAVIPDTEAAAIWLDQNTMGGFDSGYTTVDDAGVPVYEFDGLIWPRGDGLIWPRLGE